jgi:hypothetical protein
MSEPTSEKSRRGRFGVSLRVMMLVVLAVGCLLAWRVRRAETQQRAVAQAEKAGFRVQYDYQYSGGRATPKGKPWAPIWLRKALGEQYFRDVTSVTCLGYQSATIDTDLAALEPFDRIEACRISGDSLNDAGLEARNPERPGQSAGSAATRSPTRAWPTFRVSQVCANFSLIGPRLPTRVSPTFRDSRDSASWRSIRTRPPFRSFRVARSGHSAPSCRGRT